MTTTTHPSRTPILAVPGVIDALSLFDATTELHAGANPQRVRDWEQLKRVYIESKSHPKQQRLAVQAIEADGVHPDKLILIENSIKHLDDETEKWQLRHRLLGVRGKFERLRRKAKELVPAKEQTPWKDGVSFSASRDGKRKMVTVDSEDRMAALEHFYSQDLDPDAPIAEQRLAAFRAHMFGDPDAASEAPSAAPDVDLAADADNGAVNGADDDTEPSTEPSTDAPAGASEDSGGLSAGVRGFVDKLAGSGGRVPARVPRPIVVVGLPDYVDILEGRGDDVVLGLTDGTTMTGAEFVTHTHGKQLEVALFHPELGPVNLFRGERFANAKQRDLAKMATPMCPTPGCRTPADLCEMHHMHAWKHGGGTNVDNLVPQCRWHNRVTDDDWWIKHHTNQPRHPGDPGGSREPGAPAAPGAGPGADPGGGRKHPKGKWPWIVPIRGRPTWISPNGYPADNEFNRFGAMSVLFGPRPTT